MATIVNGYGAGLAAQDSWSMSTILSHGHAMLCDDYYQSLIS